MIRFGFVSTYPPTRCGLATFTVALREQLVAGEDPPAVVVQVLEARADEAAARPPEVSFQWVQGETGSAQRAADALASCDVVVVQHEYGIYGGDDGADVLVLLEALTAPAIVVLHTVLAAPTAGQRRVLLRVCGLASVVVVMTHHARSLLRREYGLSVRDVVVIPHGVAPLGLRARRVGSGTRVLTWGLISPGKGIEWGIRAVAQLLPLHPSIRYEVVGQTHPKVLAVAGEAYRDELMDLIAELGLSAAVQLDGRYVEAPELAAIIASADVVLLPYDSTDQATSGVLAEAVAAGVPVVATRFPHAMELLAGGAGGLVPQRDAGAMAAALHRAFVSAPSERGRQDGAAEDASWTTVAAAYRRAAGALLGAKTLS